MKKHNVRSTLLRYIQHNRVYLYPVVVISIMLLLVSFKISGTSIGIYHEYLYGNSSKDPNLLYGKPQSIRSDEWLVITQATISQEKNGFAQINPNIQDTDMSLLIDTPYLDWSAVFKPQNLSFFIMPLEYAFAFKWWFILAALLLGSYAFCVRLLSGKIIIPVLLSVIIGFSPFVFWWYQSATILPMAYAFIILTLTMNIIDRTRFVLVKKDTKSNLFATIARTTLLAYSITAFALLLYPPFQIPIVIVAALFMAGYLLESNTKIIAANWRTTLAPIVIAGMLTAGICGAFIYTRLDAVHAIANTVYPGKRTISSGGYDGRALLVTYLQPQLQREGKGDKYRLNQSESSSFILLPFFFIIPFIALAYTTYVKNRRIPWVQIILILVNIIFLVHLFVPGCDLLSKATLLSLVPHDRLLIGFGFLSVVMVTYYIRESIKIKPNTNVRTLSIAYTAVMFGLAYWAGADTMRTYPLFISNTAALAILAVVLYVALYLILTHRYKLGLAIAACLSVASVVAIHPLYRGLGPLYNSRISQTIQTLSAPTSVWAAAQDIYIENLPQISGRKSVTGVVPYPNTKFWEQHTNSSNSQIYNRYAHTFLSTNDASELILGGPDLFAISASCTRKISGVTQYIVSVTEIKGACHHLIHTLAFPNKTLFFYRVNH